MAIENKGASSILWQRTAVVCLGLFVLGFCVRVLVWQNNKTEMAGVQYVLTHIYKQEARILAGGDIGTFLTGPNPPSDANVLLHPPGYSILISTIYAVSGDDALFLIIQLLLNSLAAVIIFLISDRLFDKRTAAIAGILVALAPQFAYHSALFLPDELSVIPILFAVYCFVRAMQDEQPVWGVVCGISVGLSCWLRSNALLLPIFLAFFSFFLIAKETRTRFAFLLLAGFILTIAPVTIRNYVVFHAFIPLSLGMGTTFIEGLADYDPEGKFGLPNTDEGVMEMDVRRAGRQDYYGYLYSPDGVERERERIKTGLGVVLENPVWYFTSVFKRGLSTFRMERVPAIAPERDEKETTPTMLYSLNVPLKLFQKLFITVVFLPLFMFGLILMLGNRAQRISLGVLLIVPLYYFSVQSLIHTEYRYVLATPHLLMILAAVFLSFVIGKIIVVKSRSSDGRGLTGSD